MSPVTTTHKARTRAEAEFLASYMTRNDRLARSIGFDLHPITVDIQPPAKRGAWWTVIASEEPSHAA